MLVNTEAWRPGQPRTYSLRSSSMTHALPFRPTTQIRQSCGSCGSSLASGCRVQGAARIGPIPVGSCSDTRGTGFAGAAGASAFTGEVAPSTRAWSRVSRCGTASSSRLASRSVVGIPSVVPVPFAPLFGRAVVRCNSGRPCGDVVVQRVAPGAGQDLAFVVSADPRDRPTAGRGRLASTTSNTAGTASPDATNSARIRCACAGSGRQLQMGVGAARWRRRSGCAPGRATV